MEWFGGGAVWSGLVGWGGVELVCGGVEVWWSATPHNTSSVVWRRLDKVEGGMQKANGVIL